MRPCSVNRLRSRRMVDAVTPNWADSSSTLASPVERASRTISARRAFDPRGGNTVLLFENCCARGQFSCLAKSFDHATRLGDAFSGDIKGCSVVDGGADDGQSDGDVDACLDAEHFDGTVTLVVVHRHDQVVVAAAGEEEGGVGG